MKNCIPIRIFYIIHIPLLKSFFFLEMPETKPGKILFMTWLMGATGNMDKSN